MKIILKQTGQVLTADRIEFPGGNPLCLTYERDDNGETGEVLVSAIERIVDAQTYDNELSGH